MSAKPLVKVPIGVVTLCILLSTSVAMVLETSDMIAIPTFPSPDTIIFEILVYTGHINFS